MIEILRKESYIRKCEQRTNKILIKKESQLSFLEICAASLGLMMYRTYHCFSNLRISLFPL